MKQFKQMYGVRPVFSVEIYPPKTEHGLHNLYNELAYLTQHHPAFISVTYGAGGSTRDKTLELAREIGPRFGVTTVPHFTSIGASRADVRRYVADAIAGGARNMVVLRGDMPRGETNYAPPADGFRYGSELVEFVRSITDEVDLAVAGYPEGHVECRDLKQDVQYLKRKVDAGASIVLTQLFYNNADYFRFRDETARAGISIPIVPGLMPITKFSQIQRIASLCGANIPAVLSDSLLAHEDGSHDQVMAGVEYTIRQCRELLQGGAPGLHICTLNSGHATSQIIHALHEYFDDTPAGALQ